MSCAVSGLSRSGASINRRRFLRRRRLEPAPPVELEAEPRHSLANFIRASSAAAFGPPACHEEENPMEMEKIHVFARSLLSTYGDKAELEAAQKALDCDRHGHKEDCL